MPHIPLPIDDVPNTAFSRLEILSEVNANFVPSIASLSNSQKASVGIQDASECDRCSLHLLGFPIQESHNPDESDLGNAPSSPPSTLYIDIL